jgi:tetratricopeptide (TPR) repeat protein
MTLLPGYGFAADSLTAANADLQVGRADDAVAKLNEALKSDPKSSEANNLLCRVEYTLQEFNEAADHCEKAVNLNPQNARHHLWFGRALGERASHASFLNAFSLAKKAREQFEVAAKLDPRDAEALADLGQFYEEAPSVVGGGIDKAEAIATQLDTVDPARAHNLRGEMAEKRKDLSAAEQEFKAAITAAKHPALQWMELASFYRRQSRWPDMESAINTGATAAAHDQQAVIAFDNGASILVRADRHPEMAIKFYETYLASPQKTEESPAFETLTKLAKLRQKMGDTAGAQHDRASALALAHDYKPAQELKF